MGKTRRSYAQRISFYPRAEYFELFVPLIVLTDQPVAQVVNREIKKMIDSLSPEMKRQCRLAYEKLTDVERKLSTSDQVKLLRERMRL